MGEGYKYYNHLLWIDEGHYLPSRSEERNCEQERETEEGDICGTREGMSNSDNCIASGKGHEHLTSFQKRALWIQICPFSLLSSGQSDNS